MDAQGWDGRHSKESAFIEEKNLKRKHEALQAGLILPHEVTPEFTSFADKEDNIFKKVPFYNTFL